MYGNVFIRESKPLLNRRLASQGQQSNDEKRYFFSLSILTDDPDNPHIPKGIIKVRSQAKEVLEDALAQGITTPGETAKGPYEMLTIEFDEKDLVKVGNTTFLMHISNVY